MKYPFRVISIECNNNEQLIKVQQELLKNGIEWQSGDRELLYTNLNRTIYSIDLRNKTMVYWSKPDTTLVDIKEANNSHEDKIYNYYELNKVLNIIKYGKIIPNYKPKKRVTRSLNESYSNKTTMLMIEFQNIDNVNDFINYCNKIFGDDFIKTYALSRDIFSNGYNYGVLILNNKYDLDVILNLNTIYFTPNRSFFEDGDFHKMYKNECYIHDKVIGSDDKKSFIDFILKYTDIKLKTPVYQSKTNKRLLESNQISIPKIYCENREESVLIEEILHSFGFTYDSGSKYIIKNGPYNDVTITEIDTINKIFSGVVGKSTPDYVNFSDIKDKFKIMLGVKPSYVPKNKIDRKID